MVKVQRYQKQYEFEKKKITLFFLIQRSVYFSFSSSTKWHCCMYVRIILCLEFLYKIRIILWRMYAKHFALLSSFQIYSSSSSSSSFCRFVSADWVLFTVGLELLLPFPAVLCSICTTRFRPLVPLPHFLKVRSLLQLLL